MHRFRILRVLYIFDECLTKYKNNKILLYKISCRFLPTAKIFNWAKNPHYNYGQKVLMHQPLMRQSFSFTFSDFKCGRNQ